MLGSIVFAVFAAQATPPKVTYQDGSFVVAGALGTESVPVTGNDALPGGPAKKSDRFSIVVGTKTIAFDAKGLSISQKGIPAVSRLNAVPTSGKIATKESNAELMKLVKEGKRKLEVSALSGWEKIGDDLFLLVRWDGSDKKPWLEALMRVNLGDVKPKAQLVGRFKGFSFAQGIVDDVLTLRTDKLSVLTDNGDEFGISRIPVKGTDASFEGLGDAVGKAKFSDDGSMAWTLTPTPYGTNILGIADLDYGTYHVVTEVRGKMTGVLTPAYARYKAPDGPKMINLMTGAEMNVLTDTGQRQTANGLLVWTPANRPLQASLLDPNFRRLASWTAPSPTAMTVKPVVKKLSANNAGTAKPTVKLASVSKSVAAVKKPGSKTVVKAGSTKKTTTASSKKPIITISSAKSTNSKSPVKKLKSKAHPVSKPTNQG